LSSIPYQPSFRINLEYTTKSNALDKSIYSASILFQESIAKTQSVTDSRRLDVVDFLVWNQCCEEVK